MSPLAEPTPAAEDEADARALRVRKMRLACGAAAVVGGVLMTVSLLFPWLASDYSANPEDDAVLGAVVIGILAIAAGTALMVLRIPLPVALGLLIGTAVAAGLGVLQLLGTLLDGLGETPGQGWSVSLVGHVVYLGGAVVGLAGLRRVLSLVRISWGRPRAVVVAIATVAGALCLVDFAMYLGTADVPGYWVFLVWIWVLVALATPVLGLALAPAVAGRAMVAAWAVGLFGLVASGALYAMNNSRDDRYLSVTILACGVLLVTSLVRSSRSGDDPARDRVQVEGPSPSSGPT